MTHSIVIEGDLDTALLPVDENLRDKGAHQPLSLVRRTGFKHGLQVDQIVRRLTGQGLEIPRDDSLRAGGDAQGPKLVLQRRNFLPELVEGIVEKMRVLR